MNHCLYPDNWPDIARTVKEAGGWRCQSCNRQCRRPGELNLGWQYQLTVSHYFHEYESPVAFVVALCAPCHLLHDAKAVWLARRRIGRHRQRQAGQLALISGY